MSFLRQFIFYATAFSQGDFFRTGLKVLIMATVIAGINFLGLQLYFYFNEEWIILIFFFVTSLLNVLLWDGRRSVKFRFCVCLFSVIITANTLYFGAPLEIGLRDLMAIFGIFSLLIMSVAGAIIGIFISAKIKPRKY